MISILILHFSYLYSMITKREIQLFKSLKNKRDRDEHKLFAAETPKLVADFLRSGARPHSLFVVKDKLNKWKRDFPDYDIAEISNNELDRLSHLKQPHEVAGLFYKFELPEFRQDALTLVLDRIADPGNMGTLIRTADWFGVKNIICSEDSADVYNPKVVQSTMGSLARMNIYYKSAEEIRQMLHPESRIFGADMQGTDLKNINPGTKDVILIGSEAHGIQQFESLCTEMLSIPLKKTEGGPESLNAAVAGSIMLYHFTHAK